MPGIDDLSRPLAEPLGRPGRVASTCSLTVLDRKFYRPDPVSLTTPRGHLA